MKKSIKKRIAGLFGLIISGLTIMYIWKIYKYFFIHYCLYSGSKIIIPAKMHMLVSMVTMFPLTMVLFPILIIAVCLIPPSISLIVKRK